VTIRQELRKTMDDYPPVFDMRAKGMAVAWEFLRIVWARSARRLRRRRRAEVVPIRRMR
jgi:hypothetical protein